MAEKKPSKNTPAKKPTARERTLTGGSKTRRLHKATSKIKRPIKGAASIGRKEYHPIKLPDNRLGRVLNKRGRFFPKFIREAWAEIRQVTWPTPRETVRLTTAVFIFSVIFAVIVAILDYGLDKAFREVIIK